MTKEITARLEEIKRNSSEWEIWIDDLDGEIAMEKSELAAYKISVVDADSFNKLITQLEASLKREAALVEALEKIQYGFSGMRAKEYSSFCAITANQALLASHRAQAGKGEER